MLLLRSFMLGQVGGAGESWLLSPTQERDLQRVSALTGCESKKAKVCTLLHLVLELVADSC